MDEQVIHLGPSIEISEPLISVVVVDDHPLFRRGVVELLNDSGEMRVIAEYDSALPLLEQLDQLNPDILMLDLQMPEKSGIDVLKQIRESNDQLRIVIITACDDQEKLLEAISYGANGYLQKDTSPEEILLHLHAVMAGNVALNPNAITSIATHLRQNQEQESSHCNDCLAEMTERERETLYFIAKGLNNKLIARELGISDGTVKVYVKNLLRKLNLHSRLELAAWAHQNSAEALFDKEL